jgi:hypothetical protein
VATGFSASHLAGCSGRHLRILSAEQKHSAERIMKTSPEIEAISEISTLLEILIFYLVQASSV